MIITDDIILENNEEFKLTIISGSLPDRVHINKNRPSEVTVIIMDDDCRLLIPIVYEVIIINWPLQLLLSVLISQHTVLKKIMDQYNLY